MKLRHGGRRGWSDRVGHFLFYIVARDGAVPTFEAYDCADGVAAYERAESMLRDHPHAAAVEVWDEQKLLFIVKRQVASELA